MTISPRVAIAIPAHNEAGLIGRCLAALDGQRDAGEFTVVVFANNCSDDTATIVAGFTGLALELIEADLPPDQRGAGFARRVAMAEAGRQGEIVLTTDADCIPDPNWIAAHRAAFAAGVDAVAGRVSADQAEMQRLPAHALAIGKIEWDYLTLLARAEMIFAAASHDPWPRHAQCCGANLGITSRMLAAVGGVPAIESGEDRALIGAVQAAGGRVRFDTAPHVTASARLTGRAQDGMAAALTARLGPDYRCDAQFRPVAELLEIWARGETMWTAAPPAIRLTPQELVQETEQLRALIEATHE